MLDSPGGRGAEGKGEGRDDGAGGMPAAVAEDQDDRQRADEQRAEHRTIAPAEIGRGIERGDQGEGRREDQRLWIGDLRRAGEDVRRPERGEPAMPAIGEELKLGVEMGLGVPGDGDGA
jgi:hypothetical protein